MRKIFLFFVILFISFLLSAASYKFSNGITLDFFACEDESISFEAKGNGVKEKNCAPVKQFELKRKFADSDFIQNENNYIWKNYTVSLNDDGYTLYYNNAELYTAKFSEEKKLLREIRTWKTATEFYGFGQANRNVSLRNQSFTIWNVSKYGDHAYLFVPFYVTNDSVCIYYNAGSNDKIFFQDGNDSEVYRSEYHRIQYFVRKDNSIKESVQKFYNETESHCILPKWSYGFIQSKYGYKSQEETISIINEFKKRKIPISALVLDLYWFNKMGDISYTSPNFPNPKQMDSFMEENGVKLITITEPFFTTDSINYTELEKNNMLAKDQKGKIKLWRDWWCINNSKEGALLNPLAKKTSDWLGKKYFDMTQTGIDGFWTDLGEPEGASDDIMLGKIRLYDFHNYYNYYWTKALYDGMKKQDSDRRLFIMSRSGYTGSGKFNVSIWSGDVAVSWPSLEHQIGHALNSGISGFSYWGSDVGGFTPEKTFPELFVRWYQFGTFTPIFRAHGTDNREPWTFTDKETKIVTKYINYRTALLPYVYSTARQTMNGIPMMRPLFYEQQNAPQKYIEKEYLFGDFILVAPVTREMNYENEKEIYLPEGNWYDFETLKKIDAKNGLETKIKLNIETIPIYIKSGAIIPCQKDEKTYLFLLPDENTKSSFTFYNDDGETEQYKNGAFAELHLELNGNKLNAITNTTAENKKFLPKEFTLVLPAQTKTKTSDWKIQEKYKLKTATLEELQKEIEL